ncbi:MAG: helix-turn-helix domain-containing protein [Haloarculaceae archaeon]
MRRQRAVSGALLVVSVLAVAVFGGMGVAQTTPDTDHTVTRVQVHPDGSATWTVRVRTRLNTEDSIDEFEAFQTRFEGNTSLYLDPFRQRIQQTVATAENETGRRMRATNFSASTDVQSVPRTWGVVTYQFTWTSFARQSNDRLVVGDVFEGGFFLADNDTLALSAPPNWTVEGVDPDPVETGNGTARWIGKRDFPDNRPRAVFAPGADGGDSEPGQQSTTGATGGANDSDMLTVAVIVFASTVVTLAGFVLWRRWSTSTPQDVNTVGAGRDGQNDYRGGTVPTEPVPDEERVRQLLRENGGQMRQADIVDSVDWSKSKTSRVLASMAEEGSVEKIRLGRENVVRLEERD